MQLCDVVPLQILNCNIMIYCMLLYNIKSTMNDIRNLYHIPYHIVYHICYSVSYVTVLYDNLQYIGLIGIQRFRKIALI